jgi:succinate dehydrogenase / fumarate reductase iron-sulfur subunit
MEDYSIKVMRFNPNRKESPHQQNFKIRGVEGEKVTYGLTEIYRKHDPSLSYIFGCRTGHCGLCGMMINGEPKLACRENLGEEIELKPLEGLPVIKDLVVDREAVFRKINERISEIINLSGFRPFALDSKLQLSPEAFLDKTNCLLCLCCLAVCPCCEKEKEGLIYLPLEFLLLDMMNFVGIVDKEKGRNALEKMGLGACTKCKKCQRACPSKIQIYDRVIEPMMTYFSL